MDGRCVVHYILREFDEGKRDGNCYATFYENADGEEGEEILVFEDWESVRQMEKALLPICSFIPDFTKLRDTEYDTSALDFMLEGDENWTFYDEGFVCAECYKWHFYDSNGATSYANYQIGDGYIICEDCIRENKQNMEEYLRDMIDAPRNANTILTYAELRELGFEKVNEYPYAEGWYGRHSDPTALLKRAQELYEDCEFVFSVVKNYNPFETEFDLWKRERRVA